jgi:acyl carrier protein
MSGLKFRLARCSPTDSVAMITLANAIGHEFNIQLDGEELNEFNSVGNFIESFAEHRKAEETR